MKTHVNDRLIEMINVYVTFCLNLHASVCVSAPSPQNTLGGWFSENVN